jgi:Spy/CpxP family protein refolding chaperone
MTMAAVVTLSASLVFAAPHDGAKGGKHGRGGRGGEFSQRMAEKLNLTNAQKQQIKDLNTSFRDNNKAFFDNAQNLRQQFRAAKEANDTAKLESLKPQMEAQHAQMKQLHEAQQAKFVSILTAEQRTQWEALKAQREQRRAEHGPRGQRND